MSQNTVFKMPSNYYCADNFFKKMTDLDSPRRNNDCYFYYYSTCAKGDSCTFRHEPSALGCETMCSFWKEGKCLNIHCNYRHMELRKNRKAIQCYWETQPGGCLKPHCPFLHQNVKQPLANFGDNRIVQNTDAVQTGKSNETLQLSEKNYKSSVDPLVVNFEEESDTESAPSPIKIKKANIKTLEEIKLEKIQEESAAYFSFNNAGPPPSAYETEDDLRLRLLYKMKRKQIIAEDNLVVKRTKLNFSENKSLDEHIRILSSKKDIKQANAYREKQLGNQINQKKNVKGFLLRKFETGINAIKIKTLEEIRAERLKRREMEMSVCVSDSENIVTSTSKDEIVSNEPNEIQTQADTISNRVYTDIEYNNMAIDESGAESIEQCVDEPKDCSIVLQSRLKEEVSIVDEKSNEPTPTNEQSSLISDPFGFLRKQPEKTCPTISNESDLSSNKMAEEVLLLEDDEDYVNVNFKAEDELLDEIDDILGN